MQKPLISVLVPMYNVENYVARCIESILNQTYENLEIVLLDDSSTDKTFEIASNYAALDKRIKLVQKENEANLALTRNYLLSNFSGDYFVWVDSDDCVKPNYVEKLYSTLIQQNSDIACCDFHIQTNHREKTSIKNGSIKFFSGEGAIVEMVLRTKIGKVLWNKIYKRELLEDINFDPNVKFGEDLLFLVKYLKKCEKVAYIKDKLYYYTWRKNSEIHQGYGAKQHSFILALKDFAQNEDNQRIKETILTWVCCSSVLFCFLARKDKPRDENEIRFLKATAHETKNSFSNNKDILFPLKMVINIGLGTWCKKPKDI